MGRREIFAGNWKMHKTGSEGIELVNELIKGIGNIGDREIAVFPPSPYAGMIVNEVKGKIDIGIQNFYFEEQGAFTGEIAPAMVKDIGCRYILIFNRDYW